jgi:hypothetical protein
MTPPLQVDVTPPELTEEDVAIGHFAPQKMFDTLSGQWGYAGFKDAHHPQSWNHRLRLVEEATMAREPDVDRFPTLLRIGTRISAHIPPAARRVRILRYEF